MKIISILQKIASMPVILKKKISKFQNQIPALIPASTMTTMMMMMMVGFLFSFPSH